MFTSKALTIYSAAAVVSCICVADAGADIILADGFTDADRSSSDGTIGSWDTVNGISAPSTTLQFFDGDSPSQVGFHNNGANPGTFDVNNNMTAGGWDTTITLVVGGVDINLTDLVIDIKLTNGSGGSQTTGSKSGSEAVEFFDVGNSSIGSATTGTIGYPTVEYQRTLDLSGITLSAGQTYTMVISARGTGFGHHKALDAIELNGTAIPEPGSLALLGLGGLIIARRRRG